MADSDLSAEQTTKLTLFQEITHIKSLQECRQILEVFEWNIESAVQSTFGDQVPTITRHTVSSSSLSSIGTSISNGGASTSRAANNNNNNNNNNSPLLFANHSHPPPSTPPAAQSQPLPAVNVFTQRALSYHSTPQQAVVPRGFFQWSIFLISFPFRLIFSSLVDLASFFWSMFESDSLPIEYDPLANVADFVIDYNQRFGTNHPDFYQGSYSQVINEAKRDLKFVLVYLHQIDHKDSSTLASETMTSPELIEYLNANFLVWACSKNLSEGRKVFNAMKAKRCPFLGVIVLKHSRMTLVSKIEGPIKAGELMLQLASLLAECEPELVAIRHDREQRSQTQILRQQQDEAYLESLRADREKAMRKQEQEEEARRAVEAEKRRNDEEIARKNNIMTRKSDLRKRLADLTQPEASDPLAIKLVVKLPTGTRIERVFLKSDHISLLYQFVFSHEECPHSFEIVKNFPRQVIDCNESTQKSISEHGINQPMLLFVNDLDA